MTILRFVLVSVVTLLCSCDSHRVGDDTNVIQSDSAIVVTSNYPLYFFANRIVEGVVAAPEIVFPEIEGDPASWTPNAEQIQLIQSADAVILNGAGAESWLSLISIDQRRLVDTSGKVGDQLIPLDGSLLHQHGPDGEHSHQGFAFTLWLDPQLAISQAQSICNALIDIFPAGEISFRENMARLEQDLSALDSSLAEVFSKLGNRPVLFSHPVYQYLQRKYEMNAQSVHWEPQEAPSTSDWIELQQLRSSHSAMMMIWEDEPLTSSAERLSDAGITSVTFHTLANRPGKGDYFSVMRANVERMKVILSSD